VIPRYYARSPLAWLALCALWAFVAAGCASSLQQTAPEKRRYVLAAERPDQASPVAEAAPVVLKVKRLDVSPAFAGQDLLFRTTDAEYAPDRYNLYLVHPRDMLTQATRAWLAASGMAATVTGPESALPPDYVLEGGAVALYADLRSPATATAVLELQFFLIRDTGLSYDVVWSQTFRQETPMKERSAQAAITALNEGLAATLEQLEVELAGRVK